jgi:hypothetical protein
LLAPYSPFLSIARSVSAFRLMVNATHEPLSP